ncbi:MAG TPA: hypothetical protein P5137_13100, partial [Candidatus Brocadiia bacterium]|nr:hypothetical protein [Candidatus Brocadiia bacterium]
MKTVWAWSMILLAAWSMLAGSATRAADAELLKNRSFETPGGKVARGVHPLYWSPYEHPKPAEGAAVGEVRIVRDDDLNAKTALEIIGPRSISFIQTVRAVQAGETLTLKFRAKGACPNGGAVSCSLGFLNSQGRYGKQIPFYPKIARAAKPEWQEFSFQTEVPTGTAQGVNVILGVNLKEGESVRLADVSL